MGCVRVCGHDVCKLTQGDSAVSKAPRVDQSALLSRFVKVAKPGSNKSGGSSGVVGQKRTSEPPAPDSKKTKASAATGGSEALAKKTKVASDSIAKPQPAATASASASASAASPQPAAAALSLLGSYDDDEDEDA